MFMEALKSQGGFTVSQGALEALRETYASGRASEAETSATIASERNASGEVLWEKKAGLKSLSLCAEGNRIYWQRGNKTEWQVARTPQSPSSSST